MTRRQFLIGSAALLAACTSTWTYATEVEPHWLEVVERPLVISGLPQALFGARLVQFADIHVGPIVSDDYVLATFRRVAGLRPDIVVVTGDFASSLTHDMSHCARIYSRMPRGRLGTFGVLGNHDYGYAWSDGVAADRLATTLGGLGVRILRNEAVGVAGLQMVGFDDLWAGQFDPGKALREVDARRPMLGICHNPDCVDLAGWNGFSGWVLSGHTHGGQCRPPFLAPPQLPVKNRRYTAGEFALSGHRRMYISRGVGHLLQARFLVRPEVTVFTLTSAQS